ncbi:MAG: A24 family peptidase [Chloroflexi bacterium]|nr:A24 family peptidase [Chloroflexota bacterium]
MDVSALWAVIAGLVAGGLINYLADVLPIQRKVDRPTCRFCGARQSWRDYLLLKGCPECGRKTVWRKVAVLLLSVSASVYLWVYPARNLDYWIGITLAAYLGLVAVIDLEHRLVLHPVSIAGLILGLIVGTWLHGIWRTLLGGAAGFASMLLLYYLGELFAKAVARMRGQTLDEVALGFGDVNLSGILGLILGWPGIFAGLVLAIVLGGAVSLVFLLVQVIRRGYQPFTAIPYAPFLILGAVILLLRN